MSGFAAVVNFDGEPVDRALLDRMARHLTFRGPDERRIWIGGWNDNVGLVHAKFATTFESEREHQPLTVDGNAWITGHIRVDARDELRDRLITKERRDLADATDAELLLHAYAASGTRCVDYLLGDFGFALWDKGNRLLWCATDHMGIRPVFYERHAGTVVISNTLDRVRLDIRVTFVNDDYVWTWCTELPGSLRFEQNTLHALASSMEELKSCAGNAVPSLGQDAAMDAFILKALDGRTSVMAAAEAVMAAYPGRFKTRGNATSRVGDLAVQYGKERT